MINQEKNNLVEKELEIKEVGCSNGPFNGRN